MTNPLREAAEKAGIDVLALAAFANEAASYFEKRPTGGEDAAHWSNVYNAENCRKIATALQSQAAALAEARRDLAAKEHMWLYECEKNAEWLENYMQEHKRAIAAGAERTIAEAKLKVAEEALRPFAAADNQRLNSLALGPDIDHWPLADAYGITLGDIRRAREALATIGGDRG